MEKIERRSFTREFIIVTAIAEFFSLFTLWIIDSPIRYVLFIIETLSIITIYASLCNYDFKFNIKNILVNKNSQNLFPDIMLICFAAILIVYKIFRFEENIILLILAFLCTSILSGYALLNIFKISRYFSKLEILVLSYLTSFIFSGFCTLVLLWSGENQRTIIIASFFIGIGILSAIRHVTNKDVVDMKPKSLSKNIDVLALIVSITFYVLFFSYIYPNFATINDTDISRHYNDSIILSRTPDLYAGFSYILFHAFYSTINVLSGFQPFTSFQTILIILNCFLPLAVYVLAKRFLEDIDRRIPSIAVIFYAILSSFSFIAYTQFKILDTPSEIYNLSNLTAEKAYNGTINFLQPFPWFVPLSVAFVLLIVVFFLLRIHTIPRSRYVPLLTSLIIAMYLTHPPTAVILVIFIACYSLASKTKSLRINDALFSSLIASIFEIGFVVYTSIFWSVGVRQPGINLQNMLEIILLTILVVISLIWRRAILYKIHFSKKIIISKNFYPVLSLILVSVYLVGFLTWFLDEKFTTSSVFQIGVVPWFIYPLMLGITGLLAILSVRYLGDILPNSSMVIILMFIPFMVLIGHILSFVNLNILQTGYWEKRFLFFIFLSTCLVAPIPIIKFIDKINMNRKIFTVIISSVITSLIIISGFSSMTLQSEYWYIATHLQTNTDKESQAISYLKNILQHDPRAFTITLSHQSMSVLTFAAPPYQYGLIEIPTYSKYPDIPLFSLNTHDLPHAYVYMANRDFDVANGKESWFVQHFLPMLPVVFSNEEVTIYNASHVSFPLPRSDTTMLIPTDSLIVPQNSWFFAYDIISKQDTNYTVMYDRDQNALTSKNVVLSYDPPENNVLTTDYDEFSHPNNWNIMSGKWKFGSNGLHGSGTTSNPNSVILIPALQKNMTIDTSFRIESLDPRVANYISIIYSWVDPHNYETAEISILNDKIFVSFQSIRNDQFSRDPVWPGLPINLKWKPGDLLTLNLVIQGKSKDLSLNGTKYLHRDYAGKSGHIGLSYGRVNDVVFEHFNVHESNKINVRDPLDYISYVKSGGNLIVYNTNGYGSIFNSLFTITGPNFEANRLIIPSGDYSPIDSTVEEISPSSEDVIPSYFYTSPLGKSSILLAQQKIGLGKITYLNIYPLISSFQSNKINGTNFQDILEKFSEATRLEKIGNNLPSINDIKFSFNDLNGSGSVLVNTTSIIFANDMNLKKIIMRNGSNEISVVNVTKLDIVGYRYANIHGNFISIADGRGLYSNLDLGNSPYLLFSNNVNVTGVLDNNKLFNFNNVSSINILDNESVSIYARQPTVNIHGNATFTEPRGAQMPAKIGQTADAVNILGNASFTLFLSDSYNLGRSVSMNGIISAIPPISQYNEITSFNSSYLTYDFGSIPLVVYGMLSIPFFVTFVLILPRSKVNDHDSFK